jgi:hypothetical protein
VERSPPFERSLKNPVGGRKTTSSAFGLYLAKPIFEAVATYW